MLARNEIIQARPATGEVFGQRPEYNDQLTGVPARCAVWIAYEIRVTGSRMAAVKPREGSIIWRNREEM